MGLDRAVVHGTFVRLDWRPFALVALWTVNAIFLAVTLAAFVNADVGIDWAIYVEAGERFGTSTLYEWGDTLPWRYSPLLAPVFGLIAPIGYVGWSLLHFAALFALPRKLALLALVSAPFWADVYNGNTMTFVFVAAWWALTGNRWGTIAFLILCVLIPRPVMLPVLAWLLWNRREWIVPFAGIAIAGLIGALLTGWADEWLAAEIANLSRPGLVSDLGPSSLLGPAWYPVGVALAVWLTIRGRLGWASFLAPGYWGIHYAVMLLLEARPSSGSASPSRRAA